MSHKAALLAGVLTSVVVAAAAAQNQAAQSPHGQLPQPCAVCHSPQAWAPARISNAFDHAKVAKFPLEGAHAAAGCRSCHTTLTFKGAPRDCATCHQDPHRGELGNSCARCHTVRNFIDRSAMVRAHQVSRFPLTGAHVAADCESCHTPTTAGQMTFTLRTVACNDCHERDFQTTRSPDHTAGNFPRDCIQCHSTVAWQTARFDHAAAGFPLTGAHLALSCAQCHGTSGFGALPTGCVSCHQKDYNSATPNHQQAQFPTDCTVCHTTTTWTGASFNHSSTAFPLTGAHLQATCAQCHGDGVYKGKPTTCVSCHLTDYNSATDPNHQQAQFSTDCASCHTTVVWTSATFTNHDAQFFPIYSGAHAGRWTSCSTCHLNPSDYRQFDCLSCHSASQTNPHHSGVAGYTYDSPSCYRCHPRGRSG